MDRRTTKKSNRRFTFPNVVLISENFASLSAHANKLLLDMASKCYHYNNGDINMVWPEMLKRGWKSKETWNNARIELLDKGWIVKTRQGWNNRCSLYGFTFIPIGEFGGKLDVSEGGIATNDWKNADWKDWSLPKRN